MKVYGLNIFFLLLSFTSISQNWECIKPNCDYFYIGNNTTYPGIAGKSIKVIHIDSSISNGNDSIFYVMPTMRKIQDFGDCYMQEKPSWIGQYINKKVNGTYYFFNKNFDTITINSQAVLNQSWICYKDSLNTNVTATVDSIFLYTFSGLTDSVKRIGFSASDSDNTVLNYGLNSFHLLLSKHHGFLKLVNFYFFPKKETNSYFYDEDFAEYSFIGKNNPVIGLVDFTLNDAFDFSVGDEFYTSTLDENMSLPNPFYTHHSYFLDKIIGREDYPAGDSMVYTIDRCYKNILTDSTTIITKGNYIFKMNYHFSGHEKYIFNHLPDEVVKDTALNSIYALAYSVSPMNRMSKSLPSDYEIANLLFNAQYCIFANDICSGEKLYTRGCGGPYTYCSIWGYTYSHELLYYKKGSEIFGTPVSCSTILGNEEFLSSAAVTLFPNPMEDKAILKINATNDFPMSICISNAMGQRIKTLSVYSDNIEIYRDGMNSGIYFIELFSSKNEKLFSGKLFMK